MKSRPGRVQLSRFVTLVGYFGLLGLLLLWALWLAPHPRYPTALVLIVSVGPLLFPLRGLLHGRTYTHAWTSFLALFYFVLGVDNIAAAQAPPWLAWLELFLSLTLFIGCLSYVRLRGRELRQSES